MTEEQYDDEYTRPVIPEKLDLASALASMQTIVAGQQGRLADLEEDHVLADEILCARLRDLGQSQLVDEYTKIRKWYA